ncbi:MAG: hypothetical protein ACRD3L_10180 [Terriglobales bacterium]
MTSELTREIIVGVLSAFFTALFAGVPGAALFWWTYQRDQERLIVEKVGPRHLAVEKGTSLEKENIGPVYDIVIRNRSLFPVYVSAVGFEIDGEVIRAEHPAFPARMKKNPDPTSNRPNIQDENANLCEISSQDSIQVSIFNKGDRTRFTAAVWKAAQMRNASIESILYGPKVVAMVATETGKLFTSLPPRKRAYRWLLRMKCEIDGELPTER